MRSVLVVLVLGALFASVVGAWAGIGPGRSGPVVVGGTVLSLSPDTGDLQSFVIQPPSRPGQAAPAAITASVTADTKYYVGRQAGTAADVTVGAQVIVQLTGFANNAGTATTVAVLPPPPPKPTIVGGIVQSISPDTGDLQSFVIQPPTRPGESAPAPVTVTVTADTKYLVGPKPGASTDVKVGAQVIAELTGFANNAGTATKVVVIPPPPPKPTIVGGTVQSISPTTGDLQSFVVQPPTRPGTSAPAAVTVTVTADTKYHVGAKAGTSADVKVGAKVTVALKDFANNAGTAMDVQVVPAGRR